MGNQCPAPIQNSGVMTTETTNPVTENSSGFHIFEIHLASMGMGWITVVVVAAVVIASYYLYKKCARPGLYHRSRYKNSFPHEQTAHTRQVSSRAHHRHSLSSIEMGTITRAHVHREDPVVD